MNTDNAGSVEGGGPDNTEQVTADLLQVVLDRMDHVEARAGAVLGFAGVIVSLSFKDMTGPLATASLSCAGLAALLAMLAFVLIPGGLASYPLFRVMLSLAKVPEAVTTDETLLTRVTRFNELKGGARFSIGSAMDTAVRVYVKDILLRVAVVALAAAVVLAVIAIST